MRVTQSILIRSLINNSNSSLSKINETNAQLSANKKVLKPSDSSSTIHTALHARERIYEQDQYIKNIEIADLSLRDAEINLMSIETNVQRLYEIAIEGASEHNSVDSYEALSMEVKELKRQILDNANSQLNGKYNFSGTEVYTEPFQSVDAKVTNLEPLPSFFSKVYTTDVFNGLTQLETGEYVVTVRSDGEKVTMSMEQVLDYKSDNVVQISSSGTDNSATKANTLASSMTFLSGENKVINTGRGLSFELSDSLHTGTQQFRMKYTEGGNFEYYGNSEIIDMKINSEQQISTNITGNQVLVRNNKEMLSFIRLKATNGTQVSTNTKLSDLDGINISENDTMDFFGVDHFGDVITEQVKFTADIIDNLNYSGKDIDNRTLAIILNEDYTTGSVAKRELFYQDSTIGLLDIAEAVTDNSINVETTHTVKVEEKKIQQVNRGTVGFIDAATDLTATSSTMIKNAKNFWTGNTPAKGDEFIWTGKDNTGATLTGSFVFETGNETFDELFTAIEESFVGESVQAAFDSYGRITITSRQVNRGTSAFVASSGSDAELTTQLNNLDSFFVGGNIDVGDTITWTGERIDGTAVTGTYTYAAGDTFQELGDAVEASFGESAPGANDGDVIFSMDSGVAQVELNPNAETGSTFKVSNFEFTDNTGGETAASGAKGNFYLSTSTSGSQGAFEISNITFRDYNKIGPHTDWVDGAGNAGTSTSTAQFHGDYNGQPTTVRFIAQTNGTVGGTGSVIIEARDANNNSLGSFNVGSEIGTLSDWENASTSAVTINPASAYTGKDNDDWRFVVEMQDPTVQGLDVGTGAMTLNVYDRFGNEVQTGINIGAGYVPGTDINLPDGITISLGAGLVRKEDEFTLELNRYQEGQILTLNNQLHMSLSTLVGTNQLTAGDEFSVALGEAAIDETYGDMKLSNMVTRGTDWRANLDDGIYEYFNAGDSTLLHNGIGESGNFIFGDDLAAGTEQVKFHGTYNITADELDFPSIQELKQNLIDKMNESALSTRQINAGRTAFVTSSGDYATLDTQLDGVAGFWAGGQAQPEIGDSFSWTGTDGDGNAVSGSFDIIAGEETNTISRFRDLAEAIEDSFNGTVHVGMKNGVLQVIGQSGDTAFEISDLSFDDGDGATHAGNGITSSGSFQLSRRIQEVGHKLEISVVDDKLEFKTNSGKVREHTEWAKGSDAIVSVTGDYQGAVNKSFDFKVDSEGGRIGQAGELFITIQGSDNDYSKTINVGSEILPPSKWSTGSGPGVTFTGDYSGAASNSWTFTAKNSGEVGTDSITFEVTDIDGVKINEFTIDSSYVIDSEITLQDGVKIKLDAGDITAGDSMHVDLYRYQAGDKFMLQDGVSFAFTELNQELVADDTFSVTVENSVKFNIIGDDLSSLGFFDKGGSKEGSSKLQINEGDTIQDLLNYIETGFKNNVRAYLTNDGQIKIVDKLKGVSETSFNIQANNEGIGNTSGWRYDSEAKYYLSGNYDDPRDDFWTFRVHNSEITEVTEKEYIGKVGLSKDLTVDVIDSLGNIVTTLDIGQDYTPGTELYVTDGVYITFDEGQLFEDDAFTVNLTGNGNLDIQNYYTVVEGEDGNVFDLMEQLDIALENGSTFPIVSEPTDWNFEDTDVIRLFNGDYHGNRYDEWNFQVGSTGGTLTAQAIVEANEFSLLQASQTEAQRTLIIEMNDDISEEIIISQKDFGTVQELINDINAKITANTELNGLLKATLNPDDNNSYIFKTTKGAKLTVKSTDSAAKVSFPTISLNFSKYSEADRTFEVIYDNDSPIQLTIPAQSYNTRHELANAIQVELEKTELAGKIEVYADSNRIMLETKEGNDISIKAATPNKVKTGEITFPLDLSDTNPALGTDDPVELTFAFEDGLSQTLEFGSVIQRTGKEPPDPATFGTLNELVSELSYLIANDEMLNGKLRVGFGEDNNIEFYGINGRVLSSVSASYNADSVGLAQGLNLPEKAYSAVGLHYEEATKDEGNTLGFDSTGFTSGTGPSDEISIQVVNKDGNILQNLVIDAAGKDFDIADGITFQLGQGYVSANNSFEVKLTPGIESVIDDFEQLRQRVMKNVDVVGVRQNRVNIIKNFHLDYNVFQNEVLAIAEGGRLEDVTELTISLAEAQNIYRQVLSSGAQIIQPTLLDFLG